MFIDTEPASAPRSERLFGPGAIRPIMNWKMIRGLITKVLGAYAPYVRGILSYTPLEHLLKRGTGGTDNARYCYAVFHRHLAEAARSGLTSIPRVVAELGPGDSIGVGLAWLLAGSERYVGLDVKRYASQSRNLEVFDKLVGLFQRREPPPRTTEFPHMAWPPLRESSEHQLLDHLDVSADRVASIRGALERFSINRFDGPISYIVPWDDARLIAEKSVDLIFSQAVLEHVTDLDGVMNACQMWLRRGGWMSHQIDLRSHGHAPTWDGHWAYSERQWKLIVGNRPYLLNRRSDVDHLETLAERGFQVVNVVRSYSEPTLSRSEYALAFRHLSDESRRTSGILVQAVAEHEQVQHTNT